MLKLLYCFVLNSTKFTTKAFCVILKRIQYDSKNNFKYETAKNKLLSCDAWYFNTLGVAKNLQVFKNPLIDFFKLV